MWVQCEGLEVKSKVVALAQGNSGGWFHIRNSPYRELGASLRSSRCLLPRSSWDPVLFEALPEMFLWSGNRRWGYSVGGYKLGLGHIL